MEQFTKDEKEIEKMKNKIVVLGATGLIGSWVYDSFKKKGYEVVGTYYKSLGQEGLSYLDISNLSQLEEFVDSKKPSTIINCVGVVGKDLCGENLKDSEKANLIGVKNISKICKKNSMGLIHFSTIVVHNGLKQTPYVEDDDPTDRVGDVYNTQKSKAESFVEKVPNSIILRLGDVYGYKKGDISYLGGESFRVIYNLLKEGKNFYVYRGIKTNKTLVSDLGNLVLELYERNFSGRLNVGGDTIENYDFVKKMKDDFNLLGDIITIDPPVYYPGHKILDLSKLQNLGIKLNTIDEGFKILSKDLKI